MSLNKGKLFFALAGVSILGLCGCNENHQPKEESVTVNKSMSKLEHDYYSNNASLRASKKDIIEKNKEDIQKLPKHYLGKVVSLKNIYSSDAFRNAYISGNVNQDYLGITLENNQFSDINTMISVKRSNSSYLNNYAIYIPKDKTNDSIMDENVYLYRVPKQNLLKNEYKDYSLMDSKLSYQNLICIKNSCYKEFNIFDD